MERCNILNDPHEEHGTTHGESDDSQKFPKASHTPLEGSFRNGSLFDETRDLPDLRHLPYRRDDECCRAARHDCPRKDRMWTFREGVRSRGERGYILLHRARFPREARFVHFAVGHRDQSSIRRDLVAGLEEHDVSRNEFTRGDGNVLARASHT